MASFPSPTGGASLLLSFRLHRETILIIGSNTLAASRAFAALEADSSVVILAKGGAQTACDELRCRHNRGQLIIIDLDSLPSSSGRAGSHHETDALDTYISNLDGLRFVCVTDTVLGPEPLHRRSRASAAQIARVCRARNIPINVTDIPDLCDFSFLSTHRFHDADSGLATPLQVGVTTNGQGCRLAGRLRRDIVAKLPREAGGAVAKVGALRGLAKALEEPAYDESDVEFHEEESASTPNEPVPQRSAKENETVLESTRRRMKWVAQVSEYWPIHQLASMTEAEMGRVLDGRDGPPGPTSSTAVPQSPTECTDITSLHSLSVPPRRGRIFLVGSGPGHPALLTLATHAALTKHANLVLSDKLVPDAVLALIPLNVEVRIARKFPGNADNAQSELMEAAIEAARKGLTVVRLKQGDPTVYGRAGEEVLYFREHGFEPIVVPGVSSVLAGPTFAGVPVTQRGAAESFVVCTGVGRQGKEVRLPGYERSRTLVILMGVARLPHVLETLLSFAEHPSSRRNGAAYPICTPIALIERASMPDQRAIFSTLRDITAALESVGEQRPPGMLVVGWSVLSLWGRGDMSILDEGAADVDEERLKLWLGDRRWRIEDGLDVRWKDL